MVIVLFLAASCINRVSELHNTCCDDLYTAVYRVLCPLILCAYLHTLTHAHMPGAATGDLSIDAVVFHL